ncbi:MAG: TfoX/Sxy family protein [Candidatus Brocadiales bacterium]|nr:TfoX/Sxy family protein [Candidatus Brocadiales bacterium]
MAKEYFEKLATLIEGSCKDILTKANLEIKHFFSGAAVYANERICISYTPAGFAIKLPDALVDELMGENDTKSLQYFPKAPIKKNYVVLPKRMIEDKDVLCYWIGKSVDYVLTLPKPKKKN